LETFFFGPDALDKKSIEFVPDKPFHPGLIFVAKAIILRMEFLALPAQAEEAFEGHTV
jgi:hypothetical protein